MKISSCALTGAWPTYSSRRRGRMVRSTASSSPLASPVTILSATIGLLARRALQRATDHCFGRLCTAVNALEQAGCLGRLVSQGHQRAECLGFGARAARQRNRGGSRLGAVQTVFHLDEQTLGGLAADA